MLRCLRHVSRFIRVTQIPVAQWHHLNPLLFGSFPAKVDATNQTGNTKQQRQRTTHTQHTTKHSNWHDPTRLLKTALLRSSPWATRAQTTRPWCCRRAFGGLVAAQGWFFLYSKPPKGWQHQNPGHLQGSKAFGNLQELIE